MSEPERRSRSNSPVAGLGNGGGECGGGAVHLVDLESAATSCGCLAHSAQVAAIDAERHVARAERLAAELESAVQKVASLSRLVLSEAQAARVSADHSAGLCRLAACEAAALEAEVARQAMERQRVRQAAYESLRYERAAAAQAAAEATATAAAGATAMAAATAVRVADGSQMTEEVPGEDME